MSYLIPKDELTLTDMKQYRLGALEAGIQRAVAMKVAPTREQLTVRGFENILDAGAALEQWNTAALAVVGTAYSVFQAVATVTLPATRLVVFYGVAVETVLLPVSLLTFRVLAVTGNIIAEFDLEQIANSLTPEGFFSEPVVWDPQKPYRAEVTCRIATGVLARVQLKNFLLEAAGGRID